MNWHLKVYVWSLYIKFQVNFDYIQHICYLLFEKIDFFLISKMADGQCPFFKSFLVFQYFRI